MFAHSYWSQMANFPNFHLLVFFSPISWYSTDTLHDNMNAQYCRKQMVYHFLEVREKCFFFFLYPSAVSLISEHIKYSSEMWKSMWSSAWEAGLGLTQTCLLSVGVSVLTIRPGGQCGIKQRQETPVEAHSCCSEMRWNRTLLIFFFLFFFPFFAVGSHWKLIDLLERWNYRKGLWAQAFTFLYMKEKP